MQDYIEKIENLHEPSFDKIKLIAGSSISSLSTKARDLIWQQLNKGIAELTTHEQLCQYLFSYGNMHKAKLHDVYKYLPDSLFIDGYEIVDWGCGQGMGTINLFDYLQSKGIENKIRRITLIEPSIAALERAVIHTKAYITNPEIVRSIGTYFESIKPDQIRSKSGLPVINIFSNILDLQAIDLKHLANLIDEVVYSDTYMICVGPLNPNNRRIDAFYAYFNVPCLYSYETASFYRWTIKCKFYKLESSNTGNLIPIEFFPSIRFHAAYELDSYRTERLRSKNDFFDIFSNFEVAAPFDIGASVYEDVHPLLAVLNNIITRGLPTKCSVFIEEIFSKINTKIKREINLGEIYYRSEQPTDYLNLTKNIKNIFEGDIDIDCISIIELQELLTPVAIARFQKVIIEAIITGHLSIEKDEWLILVEEQDVPFAAMALKDFSEIFYHLTRLSEEYEKLTCPRIILDVISTPRFASSPLHLEANVSTEVKSYHLNKKYDIVVDMAILTKAAITKETFSKYQCENNCYFNVRSISQSNIKRIVYTSSLIRYKKLVEKNSTGEYVEKSENITHLNYFLQLILRKENFRPGQLPILDRAVQNLSVIGLLPTGGGKSLTYQLAALLQPGITLVVDPLRSLMKDQYDGLIKNGIDCCTYINSSVSTSEKRDREIMMESSEVLFVFVSPERLSILKFRDRLKKMHSYNVYFSYGVIDEVHCVSEWGHDFRFSYLHLGRNLYSYVKAKIGSISLFGLTATASFDVLADVERELSGNGAFALDSDVIVRYENTNRLELQYKIETVQADFAEDSYYDKYKVIDSSLPKAINVNYNFPVFKSKSDFLKNYIEKLPTYIEELQTSTNIEIIKKSFAERQTNTDNLSNNLSIKISTDFYKKQSEYESAGIIFCPHANSTGLSVEINKRSIAGICQDVGSFSGKDDDNDSMRNLSLFRDNKLPLMVATKAFGMGIDKPNVRFTVNMNYPSSLESFVQEAGRAGRDRKMALAVILLSDYEIARINKRYQQGGQPMGVIKNNWFKKNDLDQILNHYNLKVPDEFIDIATPNRDMVKLHCSKDDKMFRFNQCSDTCTLYKGCQIRKVPVEDRGWQIENELGVRLVEQGLSINKKHYRYLSADYETVMYFFTASFKGDIIEKTFMHKLLSADKVFVTYSKIISNESKTPERVEKNGFLSSLISAEYAQQIIVYVPYTADNSVDIAKAIFRMTCIDLIEDFTQDYSANEYRILVTKKQEGSYFNGLEVFLTRYYTDERASREIERAKNYLIKGASEIPFVTEIHKCLAYLTEFVYDKISEKRKRAIDDMRNFCIEGTDKSRSWLERNEDLKDYIYYYFNSKYAKDDYVAENGEAYSLTVDTEKGKRSEPKTLFKFMKVINNAIVGTGTPNDNIKHLQGAVRLLRRSLTDSNPTLSLLNAFTIRYLGIKGNKNLADELNRNYREGMEEMAERLGNTDQFWQLFVTYNEKIQKLRVEENIDPLIAETKLCIHANKLKEIVFKYTDTYD